MERVIRWGSNDWELRRETGVGRSRLPFIKAKPKSMRESVARVGVSNLKGPAGIWCLNVGQMEHYEDISLSPESRFFFPVSDLMHTKKLTVNTNPSKYEGELDKQRRNNY